MPFEQHQEKNFAKDVESIYQAAVQATQKLDGKIISSTPEKHRFTARFPKVVLGKTLGERTMKIIRKKIGRSDRQHEDREQE